MPSIKHLSLDTTLDLMNFRTAETRDISGLVELYRLFFEDSDLPSLGLVMSDVGTADWLQGVIYGSTPHIIAADRDDGRIVGSLSYQLDYRGLEKPCACLDKFYVRREWRMSGIGRVLVSLAMEDAKLGGAVAFRAGISSGLGLGQKNLFLKYGFRETPGSTLLARRL